MKPLPPDRVSSRKESEFFQPDLKAIRISVDGREYTGHVLEYDRVKGWAQLVTIDPKTGEAMRGAAGGVRVKWKHGKVIAWWADQEPPAGAITPMEFAGG